MENVDTVIMISLLALLLIGVAVTFGIMLHPKNHKE